ncbi:zeta toxin domain-containing protein [Hirsutella rhossiliensis]|uniref:Zeta toxin domain-containing protein n=1 Tax=Hirsutella rhossiliensis TaxID=111463 RepID=A0A9P8MQ21_9HYPO|nr:zeta toxin domain-containing protein [Hirsutella rhossiliensis]KAH0959145.1 zeta toxin domain-containing protein [Hirsutella rhossiliensis]
MPPPPTDLSAYLLSDQESSRIFASDILPAELPPATTASPLPHQHESSSPPLALLTVGQTGAGKSVLSRALLPALRRRHAHLASAPDAASSTAHLIADTFKTHHPSFSHLMSTAPHLASAATGPDARRWLAMAVRHVAARRLDVLVESACRHPDDFAQLALVFRRAGFRVEVLVLAVPAALSRLGILLRFHARLPEGQSRALPVRLTPVRVHDESYAGLVDTTTFLDQSAVADQVLVVRRGNLVAYGEERGPDERMAGGGGVAAALLRERERPLTQDEVKIALDDLQKLNQFEDALEQAQQVRAMLRPLMGHNPSTCTHLPELVPLKFVRHGQGGIQAYNVLRLGQP